MAEVRPLDPEAIVKALDEHGVRYIMVGALAARLHGFPRMTADMDIAPSTEEVPGVLEDGHGYAHREGARQHPCPLRTRE